MIYSKNFSLKKISWIKIGGDAKEYYEIDSTDEFQELILKLKQARKKFEIFGWAANSLISDNGLDTIVIRNKASKIEIEDKIYEKIGEKLSTSQDIDFENLARQGVDKDKGVFFGMEYDDLEFDESDKPIVKVRISAGAGLPYVINTLIDKGITGLQMFSGIPGTIGASVFNNIHGGPHLLSEYIDTVEVITNAGELRTYANSELNFAYNQSTLQKNNATVLAATFNLRLGDQNRARYAAVEWAKRKKAQPKNSLGSTFHNLEFEDMKRLNLPIAGIGYLIDVCMPELVGERVGDIQIHPQMHKNMFVNLGNGTAADYLALMKKVYYAALEKFNVRLKSEVFFKGFTPDEIKEFI